MSKILIDALEWYREQAEAMNRYTEAKNTNGQTALVVSLSLDAGNRATKALSDYASQKETVKPPSQIFFRHLDKQRKKGDALLFKHIEPVIYAAMEEYAAQFTSSAPESGQKEGIKKDDKLINHIRNVKLLQAIHGDKKFFVQCHPSDLGANWFPNSNFAIREIELPNFELYEEKLGYKWVASSAPKEGLRWVKASEENFPKNFGTIHWRDFKTKNPISATTAYSWARNGLYERMEWLDESAAAPESGGEQKGIDLKKMEDKFNKFFEEESEESFMKWYEEKKRKENGLTDTRPTKESGVEEHFKEITLQNDLEPNKSNSDVTPVASHSSTSSNSIEQENDEPFWQGQEYIQGGELPKAEQLFEDNGLRLELTCGACPEQYDVFKQVGYLRLRHGEFRVDFPDCGGVTIYEAEPKGDGIFEGGERMKYLTEAMNAILKKLKTDDHC